MAQISLSQCIELKANPGFYLEKNAARAWDRASAEFGKVVLISGAWRSYEIQEKLFDGEKFPNQDPQYGRYLRGNRAYQSGFTNDVRWWPAKASYWTRKAGSAAAAVPGTSNHGSGLSVDVKTRRDVGDAGHEFTVIWNSWTDADRTRFLRIAAKHGWYDTEGRSVNEVWHLTYYPARDQHRGVIAPADSIPTTEPKEEEFLMTLSQEDQEAVLWNARENKLTLDKLSALLLPKIKDGRGAAPLDVILERTLAVSRAAKAEAQANRAAIEALAKALGEISGLDAAAILAVIDRNQKEFLERVSQGINLTVTVDDQDEA